MKQLLDLYSKANEGSEFIDGQFNEVHHYKNVLFINPQLNGRHFYKYFLPYILMYEYNYWGTAITSMDKYKPNKEYEKTDTLLNSRQILWADYIVFPFTSEKNTEVFSQIKLINPDIKIVFNVDFNFYKIGKTHPIYDKFSTDEQINNIEDSIFYSDLTLVTNGKLLEFLEKKIVDDLSKADRFKDKTCNTTLATIPLLVDEKLIFENIGVEITPLPIEDKKTLRVGIVANNYTWEDLKSYSTQFSEVQKSLGNKVKFFVLGFEGVDNKTQKNCFPKSFKFEYVKPCSLIHYYKQLRELQLDLMFIPLRSNEFNETSENYNKFLEAGLFSVPTMVYNTYPYDSLITNGQNGILLHKKKEFTERLEHFEKNRDELKRIGDTVHNFIQDNFMYNQDNIKMIDDVYNVSKDDA